MSARRGPGLGKMGLLVSGPLLGHPGGRLMAEYPQLLHTVLDTTRPRELAEFYRQLLGLSYLPGDEPPADGVPDEADWLVLVDSDGVRKLAFQQVEHLPRTTWPTHDVPMQLHLDFTVSSGAAVSYTHLTLQTTRE